MKEANCAGCGAPVRFDTPGIFLSVCGYCRTSNYRRDLEIENLGKVAERAPLASHFQLGTAGTYQQRSFVVRGLLQLDHGLGVWNEWAAETSDGWIWIAEAQGEILVFLESEDRGLDQVLPTPESLSLGKILMLPVNGVEDPFLVTEIGTGRLVTVAGQLPHRQRSGVTLHHADMAQGTRRVATLSAMGGRPPQLFLGERVQLDELTLDPATQPEHRPDRVSACSIQCSECGAGITIQDPEHVRRIGCEHCGALLAKDAKGSLVLEAQQVHRARTGLPLGASGTLQGETVRLLAYLERSVHVDSVTYPWREYLLRTSNGGYRWLVESDGHFLLGTPVSPAAVQVDGLRARYGKTEFQHFNSALARVDYVLGECYWDVSVGETATASDYIAPPYMVSLERTDSEMHATFSRYLSERELREAFDHRGPLPLTKGVGATQPNPHRRIWLWWALYAATILGLIVLRVVLGATMDDAQILRANFGPVPANEAERCVQLTEEFDLPRTGNVEIALESLSLSQGWIGVDISLVNVDTGDVTALGLEAEQYSGFTDGEHWSEGSSSASALIGVVPAGRYLLRLDPLGFEGGCRQSYDISVRREVPRSWPLFVAIFVMILFPITVTAQRHRFEKRRWENSDHPRS